MSRWFVAPEGAAPSQAMSFQGLGVPLGGNKA
jgi:hypothetical protein